MIIDVEVGSGSFSGNGGTGAMVQFYNLDDALNWARITSITINIPTEQVLEIVTVVYNCNTETRYVYKAGELISE